MVYRNCKRCCGAAWQAANLEQLLKARNSLGGVYEIANERRDADQHRWQKQSVGQHLYKMVVADDTV